MNTSDDISSEALKQFHEGMLDIGRQALRKTAVDEREISGVTMAVSSKELPEMKQFLREQQLEFFRSFQSPKTPTR
ncbi:MAG: DUF4423 domain-containing protein [Bdellovibrionales bacterium]